MTAVDLDALDAARAAGMACPDCESPFHDRPCPRNPPMTNLDALEASRAAIGDSPAFAVVGFEQDDEQVLACFDDGGTCVFAECYGTDAAALIAAAVNALPDLIARLRRVEALAEELLRPVDYGVTHYRDGLRDAGRQIRAALAAAVTSEGERE